MLFFVNFSHIYLAIFKNIFYNSDDRRRPVLAVPAREFAGDLFPRWLSVRILEKQGGET